MLTRLGRIIEMSCPILVMNQIPVRTSNSEEDGSNINMISPTENLRISIPSSYTLAEKHSSSVHHYESSSSLFTFPLFRVPLPYRCFRSSKWGRRQSPKNYAEQSLTCSWTLWKMKSSWIKLRGYGGPRKIRGKDLKSRTRTSFGYI